MHSYSDEHKRKKKTEKDNYDRTYDDKYLKSMIDSLKVADEEYNEAEKSQNIDKMEKIDKERAYIEKKIKEATLRVPSSNLPFL